MRTLLIFTSLTLGLACVDLTPPPGLVEWRNANSGGGTSMVEGTGGGAGGNAGTGGIGGAGGGSVIADSGTGVVPGTGGTTALPDAASEKPGEADTKPPVDTPSGGGGTGGLGGGTSPDASIGTGGIVGTGGRPSEDAPLGTGGATGGQGGESSDARTGTGGTTVGTGGTTAGTGGNTGTGGVVGTGGKIGTGGAIGTGGTTGTGGSSGYNACASPIAPANGTSGGVTDFTNWNSTTARWGSSTGLNGTIYSYAGSSATMNAPKVEGTPTGLHLTGSISASGSNGYAGGGLTFLSCVKSTGFTQISFQVYGRATGCNLELQLQTYSQRPTTQEPPGGCSTTCFTFPASSQVVDLSSAVAAPGTTVTKTLSSFSNWSASTSPTELVGIQWQFTSTGSTCTIDATFTNIKFVP